MDQPLTLRMACDDDRVDLGRLAERDSARVPPAPMLVAELEGRILAARSLRRDELIADPFTPTAHLVEQLDLRAERLHRSAPGSVSPLAWAQASPRAAIAAWAAAIRATGTR